MQCGGIQPKGLGQKLSAYTAPSFCRLRGDPGDCHQTPVSSPEGLDDIEVLLELAEANGVAIDFGCRAGNCGTCVTALKAGEVSYVSEPGELPDKGSCLACIAVPKGKITLDA